MLLSEIFRWYECDFGGRSGVIDFIFDCPADEKARSFLRKKTQKNITFEHLRYDWNLNR